MHNAKLNHREGHEASSVAGSDSGEVLRPNGEPRRIRQGGDRAINSRAVRRAGAKIFWSNGYQHPNPQPDVPRAESKRQSPGRGPAAPARPRTGTGRTAF